MKTCSKCKIEKELISFNKSTSSKDGHRVECTDCRKVYQRMINIPGYIKLKDKYKDTDTSKICTHCNNEKSLESYNKASRGRLGYSSRCRDCDKIYYHDNIERNHFQSKEWAKKNPDKRRIYCKKSRNNKSEITKENDKKYRDNKYKTDELFRKRFSFTSIIRKSIKKYLLGLNVKSTKSEFLLSCTIKFFVEYIENQFTDGMTWENYGYRTWHLDHKKPLSMANNMEELEKLFHYTNTQPLDAKENHFKSNKLFYKKEQFLKVINQI